MSKGQYIGVNSPIIEKQTITVNENNINGYFDVNNGDTYHFKMSEIGRASCRERVSTSV